MKKLVFLLAFALFLTFVLVSCGTAKIPVAVAPDVDYPPKFPDMEDVTPLTDAQIADIERAYREEYGYDIKWFNWDDPVTRHFGYVYLGTMDGYTLLFSLRGGYGDPVEKYGTVHVAPVRFASNHLSATCFGYKDGEWVNYWELDLNHPKARTIYQRYSAFEELLFARDDLVTLDLNSMDGLPPLEECPYSEEDLLSNGWAEWILSEGTYLGTYHGCVVFSCRSPWDEYLTYFGPICYEAGDAIYIRRNGEMMDLDKAFTYGYLTVEDYVTIAYRHNTIVRGGANN